MVKIRLKRVGKVKQPSYRVVVADSRSPRDGRIIEAIGHYNPRTDPSTIDIDSDRALHWLQQGAQPSDQVRKLLQITGAWEAFTGEAPPVRATAAGATAAPAKSTPVKPTPAASVDEAADEPTVQEAAEAEAEEGTDAGIAPEADPDQSEQAAEDEARS